jgi:hypothetical protein
LAAVNLIPCGKDCNHKKGVAAALTPADAYFGRAATIIKQRERIKRKTIEQRRLHHRKLAA